jgi:serine/threonine protein phosphatase PrpC
VGVQVAQRSCIGARSRNEDCLAVEHQRGNWCLVLSDGAGGHGDGARAARLVVERVIAGFRSRPPADGRDLSELLLDAHDAVVAGQREQGAVGAAAAMHATVVVLMVDTLRGVALWGHVGDSRLYRWRDGRLDSVTRDDSLAQWVLDTGLVDAAHAEHMPNRAVLLAALGSEEEASPHVSESFELKPSDVFLLCSDGWWAGLDAQLISQLLTDASAPEEWLQAMIDRTLAQADPRQDNYSAIACWIEEPQAAEAADEAEPTREADFVSEAQTCPPGAIFRQTHSD